MLHLSEQHKANGNDIRFLYKGHDIEPERIERAFKRRKSALHPPTDGKRAEIRILIHSYADAPQASPLTSDFLYYRRNDSP